MLLGTRSTLASPTFQAFVSVKGLSTLVAWATTKIGIGTSDTVTGQDNNARLDRRLEQAATVQAVQTGAMFFGEAIASGFGVALRADRTTGALEGQVSSTRNVNGGQTRELAVDIKSYFGDGGTLRKNKAGDVILMDGAQTRKIRFDVKNPHRDKPHFHVEEKTQSKKWKDDGPEHRYIFKDTEGSK